MNITLTDMTGLDTYVIPVVPDGTKFEFGSESETLNTLKGKIVITGATKLKTVGWESLFPVHQDYAFTANNSRENGWEYVDFIEDNLKKPIRVVATDDNKRSIENLLMIVDEWSKCTDPAGNIRYSIKLTEFPYTIWDFIKAVKNVM